MTSDAATIDPREAAHFGALAADWWDPKGSSAMLHQLNPVRLAYIRDQIDQHWGLDECSLRPLEGKSAADVGCGAGLLAEPLARLGAEVTGVDAAPENIAAARDHADGQGLAIDYRVGGVEALDGPFDLVTSLEVVEHVADTRAFVPGLADALAEGGLLILSTPNRTAMSRLMLIVIGEGTGRIPGHPRLGEVPHARRSFARCSATAGSRSSTAPASPGAPPAASTSPTTRPSIIS